MYCNFKNLGEVNHSLAEMIVQLPAIIIHGFYQNKGLAFHTSFGLFAVFSLKKSSIYLTELP